MKKKFQSILEYCIFLGLIAAVFAAMQLYAKRGLQSSLKVAGDAMGFHSDNSMGLDEEQQKYFKQRDPKTFGKNRIKSASRSEYDAGNFTAVDVSASESAFTGANIGHVMAPSLEDMRHTPNIVGSLAKNDMSDIVIGISEVKKYCYYKMARDRTFEERCGPCGGKDVCKIDYTRKCPGADGKEHCCMTRSGNAITGTYHRWEPDTLWPATVEEWHLGNCSGAPAGTSAKKCNMNYKTSNSDISLLTNEGCPGSF